MEKALTDNGLGILLGPTLFPSENWHQSVSPRYFNPEDCEKLLRAGSRISAAPFTMRFSRISSYQGRSGRIYWVFQPDDEPLGLRGLLSSVQSALRAEDLNRGRRPGPHVTISYWAPSLLPSPLAIDPIEWTIDEILLVKGGGEELYRYQIHGRWPLSQWVQLCLL